MLVKTFFLFKIFGSMVEKQKLHTTVIYNETFEYSCTHMGTHNVQPQRSIHTHTTNTSIQTHTPQTHKYTHTQDTF